MKIVILIFLMIRMGIFFSYSQNNVFLLHTVVGDTIDKKEKIQFDLFPEFESINFKYGIIYTHEDIMNLKINTQNDFIFEVQLDSLDILKYRSNINKLLAFYSLKDFEDSISKLDTIIDLYKINDINNLVNITIDKEVARKGAYEGRRKQHLMNNALHNGLKGKEAKDAVIYQGYGEIKLKK